VTKVPGMPTTQADPIDDRATRRPDMEVMLRSLPASHQEIIVATYFGGRTAHQAADHLGLPPAVAKARLYEAMRSLSGMVDTCWPGRTDPPVEANTARRMWKWNIPKRRTAAR
jgi:DNA-directed RNA polymerase specialized sigma24 family protein